MIDVNCRAIAALAHHFGNRFAKQVADPIQSGFAKRADMRMSIAGTPASVAKETLDALGRVRMMGIVMAGMTKRRAGQALTLRKDGTA